MLVCLGDVIDDVIVHQRATSLSLDADTESTVVRRQGGSAANVAATAVRIGLPARLLAAVGADRVGDGLVDELAMRGVDTGFVQRTGRSGTVVALVTVDGQRSMLTDRGAATSFASAPSSCLHGASALHVPLYSLTRPPISTSAGELVAAAHRAGLLVSVDVSSVTVIEELGAETARSIVAALAPHVVFANSDEAAAIGEVVDAPLYVVKRGPTPTRWFEHGAARADVPALALHGVSDTTGAGDAFAAGALAVLARDRSAPAAAVTAGHRVAAALLVSRGANRPTGHD